MANVKPTLDDLVFENRNKEYGAFLLRKKYPSHVKTALGIVFLLVTVLIAGPKIYKEFFAKKEVVEVTQEVEIDLTDIEIPALDPTLPPPPPPPAVEAPQVTTVKYVPPKVVPDKEVKINEVPPTVDEMKNKAIGSTDIKGDTTGPDLNPPPNTNTTGLFGTGQEDNNLYMPAAGIRADFPGGDAAMKQYLSKGLQKSIDKAAKLGEKGSVIVYFIVEKDGSISNVRVLRGLAICASCNDEAKSIISEMPKWNPAKYNGKSVRVQYTLPIKFDFED